MGSFIEINDTLQITTDQGFPAELDLEKHIQKNFTAEDFSNKEFSFNGKKGIRIFHIPPVRVFLVHNIEGKWLYWGLINITELSLDYKNQTTSGKYKIIKIFTPEEMKAAQATIHPDKTSWYL